MNETIKNIKDRRSIRRFSSLQIAEEKLQAILDAGLHAPSGHNSQPWHFLVIQSRDRLEDINTKTKMLMAQSPVKRVETAGRSEIYHVFHHAPTVIIVSGDRNACSPIVISGKEVASYTPVADCSAAIQTMLIAAQSLGVSSCWVGYSQYFFFASPDASSLHIPGEYQPLFAVCLGYKDPQLTQTPPPGRKPGKVSYLRE